MKKQQRRCKILKIKSPYHYLIEDAEEQQKQSNTKKTSANKSINIQILQNQSKQQRPGQDPDSEKNTKECFFHLLPNMLCSQDFKLTYRLVETVQNQKGKFLTASEQTRKGYIYLNGQNITSLYKEKSTESISYQTKQYLPQQIIECYVVKVECLKLILLNLQNLKLITFYFSEFKLVRPNNIHPKQSWQIAQKYFIEELEGDFVQIKINGTEKYREETNVYGQVLRIKNGDDIKQKIISEGYVEISKNANKYLSEQTIEKFIKITDQAKNAYRGIWGLKQNKPIKKSNTQVQEVKYKKWQGWLNDKTYPKIKSLDEESNQLLSELKKLNSFNIDFHKGKILFGVIQLLFQKIQDKKILNNLDEAVKILSQIFIQMQISITNNTANMQFLKFYSKCLTFSIFYLQKMGDLVNPKEKQKFPSSSEMEKVLKTTFKTCYIGNETFNERFFGKKKQTNFENFSFDSAYLNGGISSYSEQSDYEESEQSKFQNKLNKKIATAHVKIRINSTYLISLIFKFYPSIVENNWQMCVRSNILTQDFFQHLKRQKINADSTDMTEIQRKQLSHLLKNNFADPSLLLLTIFERNTKVRTNALNCIFNMIINFQGKKMINTTESFYIQKLLKSTKSSYIPKSFIIFSGLKNTLYFLLFTLKYEKNIEIIQTTFKTICELCNQCSLLDKLEFQDGMQVLLQNYIQPVLSFPWNIPSLEQLKVICISFMSVLVSTQKKWEQIQTNYLLVNSQNNINFKLLQIIKQRDPKKAENDKIFDEIVRYFTKLTKNYFESIFFDLSSGSIWEYLSAKSLEMVNPLFVNFVSQIFKFNFDKIKLDEQSKKNEGQVDERRKSKQNINNQSRSKIILPFLQNFIPIYAKLVANQNYLNLITIITNIEYSQWSSKVQGELDTLKKCRQFVLHIFDSLAGTKLQDKKLAQCQYPCIKDIQQNSLIRLSLIKMIGYMSFCQEFQRQEIMVPSIKILLQHAKKFKTPNSVIKITWSISNWAKVQKFTKSLSKNELQECINYLIQQSSSDKEKIASNSTRGIGFFLNLKQGLQQFQELRKKCRKAIIGNLDHVIIKVRTNSTKSLRSMISELKEEEVVRITSVLEQNILKNNYNLQEQTILLIKQLGTPIQRKRLLKLYMTILKSILNQSELEYEFSQIKTIKQLRKTILGEVVSLIDIVKEEESVQIFITIYAYLVDCYSEEKTKNEKNKILEKGQERGEQVQKLIFNIKNKIGYDEQNVIATQTTLRGFQFTAKKSDLALISTIRQCALNRKKYTLCPEWSQLEAIDIETDHVAIGNLYI